MQRELGPRGLKIVGVSTEDTGDTSDAIKEFQREIPQEYTILTGGSDIPAKFSNPPGLPITIVIDREGRIVQRIIGGKDRAAFEAAVRPLLEAAPAAARNNQ